MNELTIWRGGQGTSVLVAYDATSNHVFNLAIELAIYVRLAQGCNDVYVRRDTLVRDIKRLKLHRDALADFDEAPRRAAVPANPHTVTYGVPAPNATAIAKELLRTVDPELCQAVVDGAAFYFTTLKSTYIWYPSSREIVSLEAEGPKYVCVHSRDNAVEMNTFDWALTMRTYLLGAEEHWRKTAFFHKEFTPRGGKAAYAQRILES
jgi:hypothetical protein